MQPIIRAIQSVLYILTVCNLVFMSICLIPFAVSIAGCVSDGLSDHTVGYIFIGEIPPINV